MHGDILTSVKVYISIYDANGLQAALKELGVKLSKSPNVGTQAIPGMWKECQEHIAKCARKVECGSNEEAIVTLALLQVDAFFSDYLSRRCR